MDAHIQDALGRATVVIVCVIIGNIKNYQVVCSLLKQKEPMIGLLSTFWMSGIRSSERSSL